MKFKKQDISGYPFYRVEDNCPFGVEGHIVGWVEKDALGDGWWSYKTFPNSDATRKLHETRRAAAEYLARSEDSPCQVGEGAPGGGLAAPALAASRMLA